EAEKHYNAIQVTRATCAIQVTKAKCAIQVAKAICAIQAEEIYCPVQITWITSPIQHICLGSTNPVSRSGDITQASASRYRAADNANPHRSAGKGTETICTI